MTDKDQTVKLLGEAVVAAGLDYRLLNNGLKIMNTPFLIFVFDDRIDLRELVEDEANPVEVLRSTSVDEVIATLVGRTS